MTAALAAAWAAAVALQDLVALVAQVEMALAQVAAVAAVAVQLQRLQVEMASRRRPQLAVRADRLVPQQVVRLGPQERLDRAVVAEPAVSQVEKVEQVGMEQYGRKHQIARQRALAAALVVRPKMPLLMVLLAHTVLVLA